jgi:hypothetical protein
VEQALMTAQKRLTPAGDLDKQVWDELAREIIHAQRWGRYTAGWMTHRRTWQSEAVKCAKRAAHHANRALDLLQQLQDHQRAHVLEVPA